MASITNTSISVDVKSYPTPDGGQGERADVRVCYTLNLDADEADNKVSVECRLIEDEDRLTSESYHHYELQSADPIPFGHIYTQYKYYESGARTYSDVIEFSIELHEAAHNGGWGVNLGKLRASLTASTPKTVLVPATIVVPAAFAEAKALFSY